MIAISKISIDCTFNFKEAAGTKVKFWGIYVMGDTFESRTTNGGLSNLK